ncbi:hypothetical protein [Acinetobacter shaoyimingii]|uniref:Lipoprotein n=1 Tax=Acinetobacter shaoyimingii TaxID=2715164 RepID=A0A6G8RZS4_9GAMM|nr:hypothetical protein [Acinetobacter shaoyimingii]NHB59417.1 hypothetical protein [Acinetobacter shaoyimingii]QIO07364.1 hypothetical protein G8E00_16175 [Acinetobacter shaoyimingii]
MSIKLFAVLATTAVVSVGCIALPEEGSYNSNDRYYDRDRDHRHDDRDVKQNRWDKEIQRRHEEALRDRPAYQNSRDREIERRHNEALNNR